MRAEAYQAIRDVRGVKGSRLPRGRALSHEELLKLFTTCARDRTPAGRRDAALLAILFACGARRGEIPGLRLHDYDERSGRLRVRGKGNKERNVYLRDRGARRALAQWLKVRGLEPGPLLCPVSKAGCVQLRSLSDQAVYNAVGKRARQAGLSSFSPHDLRRTLISELLDKSRDPAAVQSWAGHASLSTTKIYDRRGEAALRRVAEHVHVPYTTRKRGRNE
jgi:site-specific recombinase XerD